MPNTNTTLLLPMPNTNTTLLLPIPIPILHCYCQCPIPILHGYYTAITTNTNTTLLLPIPIPIPILLHCYSSDPTTTFFSGEKQIGLCLHPLVVTAQPPISSKMRLASNDLWGWLGRMGTATENAALSVPPHRRNRRYVPRLTHRYLTQSNIYSYPSMLLPFQIENETGTGDGTWFVQISTGQSKKKLVCHDWNESTKKQKGRQIGGSKLEDKNKYTWYTWYTWTSIALHCCGGHGVEKFSVDSTQSGGQRRHQQHCQTSHGHYGPSDYVHSFQSSVFIFKYFCW